MPIYKPRLEFLKEMIDSVVAQSYENWELCLVDDASDDNNVNQLLETCARSDSRIRLKFRTTNGHISLASNDALALASGDYCALLDLRKF